MKRYVAIFVFFIFSIHSYAQQLIIDSLEYQISLTTSSIEKGHIKLAKAYQRIDLSKTKHHALIALKQLQSRDTLLVNAYDQLGRYYFFSSKLDSALLNFDKAKAIFIDNGLSQKVASINISIGSVQLRNGEIKKATESFIESAQFFESINDSGNAAKCYANLATAFAELTDYSTAIDYNLKAISIARKLDMVQIELIALPNLATQYTRNGDKENAFKYYDEAEKLALKHNSKRSLALIYNNLGDLYLTEQSYDKAQDNIEKAIQLKQELNQLKGLEEAYYNLGVVHHKRKNYREALRLYNNVEDKLQGLSKLNLLIGLRDLYDDMNNQKSALVYARKAQILSDSLNEEETQKSISEISTKYQTAQKENEILLLNTDNQSLLISKIRNRTWAITLGMALLAAILFIFILYNNARRKRQITQHNHELAQQKMLELMKQNENDAIESMIIGQEEERKRIAGDLHDSLGSKLSTLKRQIENLSLENPTLSENISTALTLADDSYHDVRNIAHNINSGVLMDKGLMPALKHITQNIAAANNISIELIATDLKGRLPNHLEIQLFRIIQELIANVVKHASANEIIIQITNFEDNLNIIVEDNGIGFNLTDVKLGMGLKNIEKRLIKINGEYNIDSSPQSGTTFILNIPI